MSWTQIVVKGSVMDAAAALRAHKLPTACRVIPAEFNRWEGHTHILVPTTPEYMARLYAWMGEPDDGAPFPVGALLWFGSYVGPYNKSLRAAADYETLGEPLTKYLLEM